MNDDPKIEDRSGEGVRPAWLERWTRLRVSFVVLSVGLVIAGVQNVGLLNTDGVAYMRIAHYWATGQWHLMISGYWGPLLSWLMVPVLWAGLDPLVAARWAMGVSALWFWWGGVVLARSVQLTPGWVRLVAWSSIPCAVSWSAEAIVPDLLLAGCVAVASAQLFAEDWAGRTRRQVLCGLGWALAYAAKAVAFPLGLLVLGAGWILWRRCGKGREATRALGVSLLVFLLAASPWVVTLSAKYGKVTFSTSARIAHAVVGPRDVERSHPYGRTFNVPEPGRITVWEDPSRMGYSYWSPFENRGYFEHQCRLVLSNLGVVAGLIAGLGLGGVSFLGLLGCVWGEGRSRGRWCGLVPLLISLLYLPVYVKAVDHRYLEPAWPFLLISGLGVAAGLGRLLGGRSREVLLAGIMALGMAWPGLQRAGGVMQGLVDPASLYAHDLAGRLGKAGVKGPVAGHGLVLGGRVGVLTAFLLREPWVGEEPGSGVEGFLRSGAAVAIVPRGGQAALALAADPRVRDLDPELFGSGEDRQAYALHVFRLPASSQVQKRVGTRPD